MVSEKPQKRLYSNVSCVLEFYRVLELPKVNLDRTGALRFTLFEYILETSRSPAGPDLEFSEKFPKCHHRSAPVRSRLLLEFYRVLKLKNSAATL